MKREDLMIHDWVYIDSLKRPLQVEEIRTGSIMVKGYYASDDLMEVQYYDVEPLDLTLGHLRLNGWTQRRPIFEGSRFYLWRNPHHHQLDVDASEDDEILTGEGDTEFLYVHQFQHFMSMRGVNPQTFKLPK